MNIPKIIHQSGKHQFKDLSREDLARIDLLKSHHEDWEYRYWTDEDNYNLIAEHYPWFLPCYNSYKWPIQRADAVRYFICINMEGFTWILTCFLYSPWMNYFVVFWRMIVNIYTILQALEGFCYSRNTQTPLACKTLYITQ